MTPNVTSSRRVGRPQDNGRLEIALPERNNSLTQDAEWCVVRVGDEWRRIRFHDYDELFAVPGLYEKVIYDILGCGSPETICAMLAAVLKKEGQSARKLRVLDFGAGNGMVGEQLSRLGAELIVGADIIEEAAEAAERDRPGIYDSYHVVDLSRLNGTDERELSGYRFNCLTCVAALGFGDIPTDAFTLAYNLICPDGWIAFNIKEGFLERGDHTGFEQLIHSMIDSGTLDVCRRLRYQHRLGTDRQPLYYVGIVARKRRDIS